MPPKTVLIHGGFGQLGSVVAATFKGAGWKVVATDIVKKSSPNVDLALVAEPGKPWAAVAEDLINGAAAAGPLGAVICVAGGFAMGSIADSGALDTAAKMMERNIGSALVASAVAAKSLAPEGALILTGAEAAKNPTPTLLGYGVSKAATHHLIQSLAAKDSGLPQGTFVAGIAPVMLNTAANRAAMPDADHSAWTTLESLAEKLLGWASGSGRPSPGDIVKV